ncbi:MAG: hypothetical protein HJJLKODD_00752 [Phycisphaerae bacterium]|nr:hypothetical protein [Phycisphaerae bacterium]
MLEEQSNRLLSSAAFTVFIVSIPSATIHMLNKIHLLSSHQIRAWLPPEGNHATRHTLRYILILPPRDAHPACDHESPESDSTSTISRSLNN